MRFFRFLGIAILAGGAAVQTALADEPARALTFDYGGDLFIGLAEPIGDSQKAGGSGYSEKRPQAQQDLLIHGSADWAIAPNLTAGFFANIRADEMRRGTPAEEPDAADFVKAAYLHVKFDRFGDFQIGHEADVRVQQGFLAPQICGCLDGLFGTNAPQLTFNASPGGNNSTTAILDGRSTKLAWYSPDISGVSVALSYAPETSRPYRLNPRIAALGTRYDDPLNQFASAAMNWQGVLGETSVGVGGGVTSAHRKSGSNRITGRNDADPLLWDAGFLVSYAAWKFGGAYEQQNNVNATGIYGAAAFIPMPGAPGRFLPPAHNGLINRTFDVGFTYSIGPLTLGLAWSRGIYEGLVDPADLKHSAQNDIAFTGADYQWRDGVNVVFGIQENSYTPNGPNRALPAEAGLNRLYGGTDPGLNIWARGYQAAEIVTGVSLRL